MKCPKCGAEVGAEDQFCGECGATLSQRSDVTGITVEKDLKTMFAPEGAKSKLVSGLLGIFLGSFGIHRFYLGYTYIGIAQIIVTVLTAGIGGIWGFVEGILILTGHINKDAKGQPLK